MNAAHLSVVEQSTNPGDVVLRLTGEIDISTAGDLRAAAQRTLSEPPQRMILDFTGVTFCDSQGLSTLISLNREITAAGSRLVLANLGEFMTRLFDITGLRTAFEFDDGAALA